MKELAIINHIKEHGLARTLQVFKLKSRIYDKKMLLKYDQINSSMGELEVQECRGIVLEKDTLKVMSMPFTKFFNAAEGHAATIDWDTARVLEKCDGSMIQLYYDWHKDEWFAGTTGTAEGEGEVNNKMGTTFNSLFWDTMAKYEGFDKNKLEKEICYIFELTTPYNIVVKPHGESSVTLLAARNMVTLEEWSFHVLGVLAEKLGVPLVKSYDLNATNVGHLLKTFEEMIWHDEGYVVVDDKFNRIKVKNPAYVAVHHLKSKTAEHNIIGVVKTNEVDEFASTFPERREELYALKENYDKLVVRLEEGWEELKTRKPKNITPKEKKKFAMAVFEVTERLDIKTFTGLYFGLNDGKVETVKEYIFNFDNKKLYHML